MLTLKKVLDALRTVSEPGQSKDIVSQGHVRDLAIEDKRVRFTVEMKSDSGEAMEALRVACGEAIVRIDGAAEVEISFRVPQRAKAPRTLEGLAQVKRLVAVSSCKGGVGKSTVAALLARALQRSGKAVGLLDADVYGPSAPTLFHCTQPAIRVEGQCIHPVEIDGLKVMSMGFLMGDAPAVLRGPIVSGYITQILGQCLWGELDYLVIDLPPGTGDIQLTIVQQVSLDGAIIVTTPHTLSLVDVAKGILMFEKVHVPVLGVVENMASFACDGCGKTHYPFGKGSQSLQQRFGLETLAELPILPGIGHAATRDSGADNPALTELVPRVEAALERLQHEPTGVPQLQLTPGAIRVVFPDGLSADLAYHAVRCACPCASCVDEYSGQRVLNPAQIPESIVVNDMSYLGNYAVAFHWSDGHSTGIFSWEFLRQLAERAQRA